jgi:cytochrome c-type biogenesis protein CcmE
MKKSYIIAITLIAVAIAAIMSTVADSSTYASFSIARLNPGDEYHVVGKLNREKEFQYDPHRNANLFSFYLVDNKGEERKVSFSGTKPQDFEKSEQIVVVGKMEGEEFKASSILMKCPSKYNNSSELKEIKANS